MNSRLFVRNLILNLSFFMLLSHQAYGQQKHAGERIKLSPLSVYKAGPFNTGAAEIVAFDPLSQRAFFTNGNKNSIDAISLTKPSKPTLDFSINLQAYGHVNSVAVKNGLVAAAVAAQNPQENGYIIVYNTKGERLNTFMAGALPDMVTFSPNGKYILSANEGEPNDAYNIDPEGSITIIDL